MDREDTVIIIEQPLYDEVKGVLTVSKGGQTVKKGSLAGGVLGFAAINLLGISTGGLLGAGVLLASAIGGIVGKAMDKSKMYAVKEIDVVRKRILLTKSSGKNIYLPSKHEIINL